MVIKWNIVQLFISYAHAWKFHFQETDITLQTHAQHPLQINLPPFSTLQRTHQRKRVTLNTLPSSTWSSVACGKIMTCGLRQMKATQCVCRPETHARDLWTAPNKLGSCSSVVLSNLPRGSSGLYFCPAYLWEFRVGEKGRKANLFSCGSN